MQSAESYTMGVVLWMALKAQELQWQIRKTFKLPPAPVYVVAAMVGKSFTTYDSAAAGAAARAKPVHLRPLPHRRMAPWAPGVVHAVQLPSTNPSGTKRKRTM